MTVNLLYLVFLDFGTTCLNDTKKFLNTNTKASYGNGKVQGLDCK